VRGASPEDLENYELKEWYPKGIRLPSNADKEYVDDLFGKAQLITLAHLRKAIMRIKYEQAKGLLLFAFSGILARASITYGIDPKHAGGGDSGIFKVYRYWVPPNPDYRDVWDLFATRARLVAKAKNDSNVQFDDFVREDKTFSVYQDSAENLFKYVERGTADYIYTDPPYGAHIAYLDLSTMWHSWLGFEVNDEMRQKEAIEGGEKQLDEQHYLSALQKSFEQMFHALKNDAWLSLVFHHKKTNLWYSIREMLRYIGFNYVNTVAQPLAKQTFHKVNNPLRVLGESLILNFQKSATRRISQPMSLPMANLIKNVAERVIYRNGGATTEEILREVVPDLFDNDLFFDASSKSLGDILAILESDFELDESNLWQIKAGRQVGNFIPPRERIKYYVIGYLRKVGKATFDNVLTTIFPLLANGHQPAVGDVADVLKEVAVSKDGINWELKSQAVFGMQIGLSLVAEKGGKYEIPEGTSHNQLVYRLAILCQKCGFVPFIGRHERSDPMLARLTSLTSLNVKAKPEQIGRIEQIDLIWAKEDATPIWAFEIEENTPILSALERFHALLSAVPELRKRRQLTIVAPKARQRKLHQELTSSSYIGHPSYLENKITYIFSEDPEKSFSRFTSKPSMQPNELYAICKLPPAAR